MSQSRGGLNDDKVYKKFCWLVRKEGKIRAAARFLSERTTGGVLEHLTAEPSRSKPRWVAQHPSIRSPVHEYEGTADRSPDLGDALRTRYCRHTSTWAVSSAECRTDAIHVRHVIHITNQQKVPLRTSPIEKGHTITLASQV